MPRAFNLPNIEQLTMQQEVIRALPTEGQYLVVGGPGTGKSVVALLRARKLTNAEKNYSCLAFNHPLLNANEQLFGEGLSHAQWQSWFNQLYKKHFNKILPRQANNGNNNNTWKDYDWPQILAKTNQYRTEQQADPEAAAQNRANLPYLVIDEGQDMPLEFYRALINLGFENFFVVADQNQRLNPELNSTIEQLTDILGLDTSSIYALTDNFRNNYAIARLAETFYHDPASPKPNLPEKPEYDVTRPLLYTYEPQKFEQVIRRIIIQSLTYPEQLIGVLCPTQAVRNRYFEQLQDIANRDYFNQPIRLTAFISSSEGGQPTPLNFNEGGIMVMTAQACKGLEFDRVFLADIEQFWAANNQPDNLRKLFYVMTSRARDSLVLLKQAGHDHDPNARVVQSILTQDSTILEQQP